MDQKWYNEFVAEDKMERDLLFSMLSAANFLGIKPLLDLTCLKVTFMICGKEAAEVRMGDWEDWLLICYDTLDTYNMM